MKDVFVKSTGSYVPKKVRDNAWFTGRLDTSDEWIRERTGIRERHIAADDETTSQMGYQAVKQCLKKAGVRASQIGLLICATVTGDTSFPPTAKWIQKKLEYSKCYSFDVGSGCTSWLDALAPAYAMLSTGTVNRYAIVVAAERLSSVANYQDRSTSILFGDGAACVLLEAIDPRKNPHSYGVKDFYFGGDPTKTDLLIRPAGGSKEPITQTNVDTDRQYLCMEGNRVYRAAIDAMVLSVNKIAQQARLRVTDFNWWVFHQANLRISEEVAKKLKIPQNKIFNNIEYYGNSSGVTIPLCLDQMATKGLLRPGDQVGLVSFGAGFAWAAARIVWGNYK